MIKLALLLTVAAGTAFYAGGRTVYSGLQLQMFTGVGLKVTPDPSNIWSFHETVQVPFSKAATVPVLVDFDNNGKMDTEPGAYASFRVLITDMQLSSSLPASITSAVLLDDKGARWDLTPVIAGGTQSQKLFRAVSFHLTTPLSLPMSSGLKVVIRSVRDQRVTINLIGRLVSM